MSGEIPPKLGSLSNLTHLFLNANALSGDDTAGAGQPLQPDHGCSSGANDLSGEIPAELGSLSNLLECCASSATT